MDEVAYDLFLLTSDTMAEEKRANKTFGKPVFKSWSEYPTRI